MRAETGAGKQARSLGKYWRQAGATPKGAFVLPFRLRPEQGPGRRDDYAGLDWLLRRMDEYARRAAEAEELLRRGRTPRSIFADPLPVDCYPETERRAA